MGVLNWGEPHWKGNVKPPEKPVIIMEDDDLVQIDLPQYDEKSESTEKTERN